MVSIHATRRAFLGAILAIAGLKLRPAPVLTENERLLFDLFGPKRTEPLQWLCNDGPPMVAYQPRFVRIIENLRDEG